MLSLTEDELAKDDFKIKSLGKRKKVMRAIAYIKSNLSRVNGASVYQDGYDNKPDESEDGMFHHN